MVSIKMTSFIPPYPPPSFFLPLSNPNLQNQDFFSIIANQENNHSVQSGNDHHPGRPGNNDHHPFNNPLQPVNNQPVNPLQVNNQQVNNQPVNDNPLNPLLPVNNNPVQPVDDIENIHKDNQMNVKIVAALAFQLEFALPVSMPFNHNPTLTRAEQDMWHLCIGISGGNVILTALVALFTWVPRIGVHPRHVHNILQMITIMILPGGFIRSILTHGDNWAYYYILGTVMFVALAYYFGCLVACLSRKLLNWSR